MGVTGFRTAYTNTVPERLFDLSMHCVVSVALPGAWWFQFLPDMVLPVLWLRGMWTNRFEPDWSFLMVLHRTLHCRGTLQVPALVLLMVLAQLWPALAGMWLAHVAIDSVTHGEGWQ